MSVSQGHHQGHDLPSLRYWRTSKERLAQRVYLSICLYGAALQDMLLGRQEMQLRNLSWSATCSYYSLVHVGRLLSFLAFGDFPTAHHALAQLYLGGERQTVRLDWLQRFADAQDPHKHWTAARKARADELLHSLASFLKSLNVTEVASQLRKFGSRLNAALDLRNDANYEAMLIIHQTDHLAIAFRELSGRMSEVCERSLLLGASALTGYLREDPELEEKREDYCALSANYLTCRVRPAIQMKLPNIDASTALDRHIALLPSLDRVDTSTLERAVSRASFQEKQSLMSAFLGKMRALDG